jgi:hypothetical protein
VLLDWRATPTATQPLFTKPLSSITSTPSRSPRCWSGRAVHLRLSTLPAGVTADDIAQATLKVYLSKLNKTGSFEVREVTGPDWYEATITAANAPATGTLVETITLMPGARNNQYVLVDLTALVKAWVFSLADHGSIALFPVDFSGIDIEFDSKETKGTSHDPRLEIVVTSFGPTGPQGEQGEQGPAGPAGSNASSFNTITGFSRKEFAQNLPNTIMQRTMGGEQHNVPVVMDRPGSIVGISAALNAPRSAGTLTFRVFNTGIDTGFSVVIGAVNPQFNFATQAAGQDTFVAGDRLDIRVTTSGNLNPTSLDGEAVVTVQYD